MTFEVPTNKMPRNQRRILQFFSDYGSIRVMPAMRLQFLREKLNLATEDDDIFVHNLNNDLPRSSNYVGLARNFFDVLSEFRPRKRNSKSVITSTTSICKKIEEGCQIYYFFCYLFVVVESAIVIEIVFHDLDPQLEVLLELLEDQEKEPS